MKNGLPLVKEKIGVQLQSSAYYNFLTLKEILELFGGFYKKQLGSDELLNMVDLKEKANSRVDSLSGGQKQRFSIVASLVNDPEVVFLDEPTTGLDPVARRSLWGLITDIKKRGKTIILTTHYMEEAELLCDSIAIMEKGRVMAIDETHKLIERAQYPVVISFITEKIDKKVFSDLSKVGVLENVFAKMGQFELKLVDETNLDRAMKLVQSLRPESFTIGRATLEDVFIQITGKSITEQENV
jgi:ABC-2 type transport system ATP-binding protein